MKKKTKEKDILKKQVFVLEIEPYSQQCIVCINGDFKDIEDKIKQSTSEASKGILKHIDDNRKEYDEVENKRGILFHQFPIGFAMLLKISNNWIETTGIISHESLHLTSYIMRRVGINLTEDSEEAYTYLQQNILTKILDKVYK